MALIKRQTPYIRNITIFYIITLYTNRYYLIIKEQFTFIGLLLALPRRIVTVVGRAGAPTTVIPTSGIRALLRLLGRVFSSLLLRTFGCGSLRVFSRRGLRGILPGPLITPTTIAGTASVATFTPTVVSTATAATTTAVLLGGSIYRAFAQTLGQFPFCNLITQE